MLVVEEAKALALKLNNPNRVLDTITTARPFSIRGFDLVVAPHRLDEVRALNNMGIKAPSPILHYYDWPGRFTPFAHQKDTAAFLTLHEKALVLNDIGTGKTQSALWAADYLMNIGQVHKVLIVSPLSTLERVWGDGIFLGFPHRKFVVLHGTAERRRGLLQQEVDFYIVNHDGFAVVANEMKGMFDLIIVDEAAVLRNPGTRRFRHFRKWMLEHPLARLWLMTGTPTPNEPTDAWALAKLANGPGSEITFTAFRDRVMEKVGQWRYVPRAGATEIVKSMLQPSVRYTRDECFDLPDTITQTRKVALTPEQARLYKTMIRDLVVEVTRETAEGGTISAVNEAVKVQKLLQIAMGVAYGEDGENIELDASPRVKVLLELIEEAGEKVIVFVPLTGTLHMLEREVSKHWTVGVVNGAVSSTKRDAIFKDFQDSNDPRVLIAHPGTMAHGLTLTAASTIIWYGPVDSNETYIQANGRIERIGKNKTSNVIHIEATDLEHRAYSRLQNKQRLQGLLLDLIQEEARR